MPRDSEAASRPLPLHAQLIQMASAHWVSRHLYVAAQMNLADILAEGPRTAMELARSTSTDASSLYRFMRTLAGLGLDTEDHEHRFSLTAMGEALRTDMPGSVRASVIVLAGDIFTKSLEQLPYSLPDWKDRIRESIRRAVV